MTTKCSLPTKEEVDVTFWAGELLFEIALLEFHPRAQYTKLNMFCGYKPT